MPIQELHISYTERALLAEDRETTSINQSRVAALLLAPILEPETVEVCYVLCLTTRLDLIGYHEVSRGTLDQSLMHPREVFKAAVLVNAAGIVVAHNHPSGDPAPSREDLDVTFRLKNAGSILGIQLLDHIIIGHQGRFVSLKERGEL